MSERKRGTILVVDDDRGMREFLDFTLTSEGYSVVSAVDGDEALAHVQGRIQSKEKRTSTEIDLTIMDIKMPPPEGIEVLRRLRELDPDAVVILITGYASLETAIEAVRYGAYDYLTKPLDKVDRLLAVVERGLDKRRLLVNNRRLLSELRRAYQENLRLLEEMESQIVERTRELERANRRLNALDRIRSDLLANVSHELYTPLNAIIGFSQLLRDGIHGTLSAAQARSVESILNSGQRLQSSLDDLINMAQLSANEVVAYPEPVPLASVLQSMKALVEQSAQEKAVALEIHTAPSLETIWADETKLKRMLYELLSNAIKFTTTRGKVTLQATLYPPDKPHEIRLIVSDTGIGIPEDELEEIFDPFQQVDTSLSRRFGGLGLGLAIVRHYAELHGGYVWAESELGQGSTFTLALPLMSTPVDRSLWPSAKTDTGKRK